MAPSSRWWPGAFSFEDAGAAQNMITERRNVGKVVLTP